MMPLYGDSFMPNLATSHIHTPRVGKWENGKADASADPRKLERHPESPKRLTNYVFKFALWLSPNSYTVLRLTRVSCIIERNWILHVEKFSHMYYLFHSSGMREEWLGDISRKLYVLVVYDISYVCREVR